MRQRGLPVLPRDIRHGGAPHARDGGGPGSIGGGDVKLFGVLGIFLGPAVVRVMLLANLIAAVSISFAVVVGRRRVSTFAFGPYITAAVMIVLFAGHAMPL